MNLPKKSNDNVLGELDWNLVIPKWTATEKVHLKYSCTSGIDNHWGISHLPSSGVGSLKIVSIAHSASSSNEWTDEKLINFH